MVRFIFITLIKIFSVNSTTYYRIPVTSTTTIYAIITFFKFRTDIRRLCMSVVNTDVFRNKKKAPKWPTVKLLLRIKFNRILSGNHHEHGSWQFHQTSYGYPFDFLMISSYKTLTDPGRRFISNRGAFRLFRLS